MVTVTTPQEHYNLLASQTLLHILQEYPAGDWVLSSAEACEFFRQRLQPRPPEAAVAPTPAATPRPVQPPPAPAKVLHPPPRPPVASPTPPTPAPEKVVAAAVEEPVKPAVTQANKPFTLTEHKAKARDDMDDWRRILTDVAPKLSLLKTPPSPDEVLADRLKSSKVWIVANRQRPAAQQRLLKDLAHAITLHHVEACVVDQTEVKPGMGTPQLILSSDGDFSAVRDIQDTPLFPLPDLNALMEDPDQKAALWLALSDKLRTVVVL